MRFQILLVINSDLTKSIVNQWKPCRNLGKSFKINYLRSGDGSSLGPVDRSIAVGCVLRRSRSRRTRRNRRRRPGRRNTRWITVEEEEKKESSKAHWWGGGGRGEDDDDEEEEEEAEEHWCTLCFPNSRLVCSDRLTTYNERSPSWANAEKKAGA